MTRDASQSYFVVAVGDQEFASGGDDSCAALHVARAPTRGVFSSPAALTLCGWRHRRTIPIEAEVADTLRWFATAADA
jgi:hypothetical protein